MKAERTVDLTLDLILFGIPFNGHVRQALISQGNPTLDQATERLHLAGAEYSAASAAFSATCRKCNIPDHFVQHAGAFRGLVVSAMLPHVQLIGTAATGSNPQPARTPLASAPFMRFPDQFPSPLTQLGLLAR